MDDDLFGGPSVWATSATPETRQKPLDDDDEPAPAVVADAPSFDDFDDFNEPTEATDDDFGDDFGDFGDAQAPFSATGFDEPAAVAPTALVEEPDSTWGEAWHPLRLEPFPPPNELSERVEEVMRGAALMAGVGVEVNWDESPATLPVRTNGPLTDRWVLAQRRRGRDPLPRGTVSETLAASTDFGNLSFRLPGIHPLLGIAGEDTALHTREFAAAAGSPAAESAAVDGAYGLAAAALDFLHDDALARAVAEEFEARGGAVDVEHYFD